jgi:hypothetical protein
MLPGPRGIQPARPSVVLAVVSLLVPARALATTRDEAAATSELG